MNTEIRYRTFPGRTKEDVQHCLRCKYHSILADFVICTFWDTGLGMRGCRAGIGCTRFRHPDADKPSPEQHGARMRKLALEKEQAGKRYVTADQTAYQALLEKARLAEVQAKTGVSHRTLRSSVYRGTIQLNIVEKIFRQYQIDLSADKLMEGRHDTE